jgi:F420-0:gamma-glutamyl ligase
MSDKRFNKVREERRRQLGEVCLKGFNGWVLEGVPLVKVGYDIAGMIVGTGENNGPELEDGDIIAIAQVVNSKAEQRVVPLNCVVPSEEGTELAKSTDKNPRFIELVLKETKSVLKASKDSACASVQEHDRGKEVRL